MALENLNKILINTGLIISFGFGVWHFLIPTLYKWFDYIPNAPDNLIVAIRWTNFFFSLMLSGYSLLLLLLQKRIIARDFIALMFYGFLVFLWLCRVIMTIILPWSGFGVYDLMFLIQLLTFIAEFVILVIPLFLL